MLGTPSVEQRRLKEGQVREIIGPFLGGINPRWTDTDPGGSRHDRMRILYPVQPAPRQGLTMGLYRQGTHEPIELLSCETQDPSLTELGQRALTVFRKRRLRPYQESEPTKTSGGLLRGFTARLSATTREVSIGIITTDHAVPLVDEIAAELLAAAKGLRQRDGLPVKTVGVVLNINPKPGNVLLGQHSTIVMGRDWIREVVDDLEFRISFGSFYQLHRRSAELLYKPAIDMLGPVRGLRVIDGYGGIGTFGLRLARAGAETVAIVESNPSAAADARINCTLNGHENVRVCQTSFGAAELPPRPDLLIVDPNRAGLQLSGQRQIRRLKPRRILYVACGLRSLGRDLAALTGFRLTAVHLADLFPHTDHVETLALLEAR